MTFSSQLRRDEAELSYRRELARPDGVMSDRRAGSLVTLAVRHSKVIEAFRAKDVNAARYELRALADEAAMMAGQDKLWP